MRFDNATHPLPVAKTSGPSDALVFFGDTLPENIVRGKQYFIIESEKQYIKVAESPGGKPIVFSGGFGSKAKLNTVSVSNLSNLTPHPWYSTFYYSHPTWVERRAALLSRGDDPRRVPA